MKKRVLPLFIISLLSLVSCAETPVASSATEDSISSSISAESIQYADQFVIHFDSNGGSFVKDILYIKGDDIALPTPTKSGFSFAGWYYDNETFLNRCNSVLEISEEVTLFGKWVKKSVKIYLDTFYENEFDPIIKEVGETFHIEELPANPRFKKNGRIEYRFAGWRDAGENAPTEFIVKDQYYAFHANYGAPKMSDAYTLYTNDFSTDYGYLDESNSWSKIRDWPIKEDEEDLTKYINPNVSHYRDTKISDGALYIQSDQSGLHYVSNGVYLPEIAYPTNKYSVEVSVKFDHVLTSGDARSNCFDSGFGITVRQNEENKAFIAAMLDPNAKAVRVASRDNECEGSGTDINDSFYYNLPSNYSTSDYHTLKAVVDGDGPNSTLTAYFDGELAFIYSDESSSKDWLTSQATGSKIALFAGGCSVLIDSITVRNVDETEILYQNSFNNSTQSLFGDGWKQNPTCKGTSNGEYYIADGKLNINDAYPFTNYQHQLLYTPVSNFSDGVICFDLTFTEMSGYQWADEKNLPDSKYFSLVFRAGSSNLNDYGCISFRQNGRVQAYKHQGDTATNSWSGALFSYQANNDANMFKLNQTYSIVIVAEGKTISLFIDDVYVNAYTYSGTTMCSYDTGYVAALTSSISASIDNLRISRLAEVQ